MRISAVIASLNEGAKLKDCLESVNGFATEVLVFDMSPQDENLDKLSKKFGTQVINIKQTPYVELIRNRMVMEAKGNWVLMLDPDERLTPTLKERLKKIAEQDDYEAVNIPRKNIIFGKWIKHTNWWPDKQIRFFQKGKVHWTKNIHLYPEVEGRVLELPSKEDLAIVHYPYDTVSQFLERQNRYSDHEAQNYLEKGVKPSLTNLVWWPSRILMAKYIKHKGFLDGWRGFFLIYMLMVYKISVWVKIWERGND